MDLNLSEEQEQLVGAFSALYAKESSTDRVRTAEESGHDPALWDRLREVGVVEMALPEESGGWGASMVDLALVAGSGVGRPPTRSAVRCRASTW